MAPVTDPNRADVPSEAPINYTPPATQGTPMFFYAVPAQSAEGVPTYTYVPVYSPQTAPTYYVPSYPSYPASAPVAPSVPVQAADLSLQSAPTSLYPQLNNNAAVAPSSEATSYPAPAPPVPVTNPAEVDAYLARWQQSKFMSWLLSFIASVRTKAPPTLKKAETVWNTKYAKVSTAAKAKFGPRVRASTICQSAEEKYNRATEYADAHIRLAWRKAGGVDGVLSEHVSQLAAMERYWVGRANTKGKEWENYVRAMPVVVAFNTATKPVSAPSLTETPVENVAPAPMSPSQAYATMMVPPPSGPVNIAPTTA